MTQKKGGKMREFKTEINRQFGYLFYLHELTEKKTIKRLSISNSLNHFPSQPSVKKVKQDMKNHLERWR